MKNCIIKVSNFSGARISDMRQLTQPIIKNKPEFLILHVGTNNATPNNSRKIEDDIHLLKSATLKSLPDCRVSHSV